MAPEHPRLLAASLTAAFLGTACSTPNDPSNGAADPRGMNDGSMANGSPQDPVSTPQERMESERNAARIAHYRATALELRKRGELEAAKMELLKAREYAPGDDHVRSELAAVQAELGEPAGTITTLSDEWMKRQQIAEDRARATVQNQVQSATQAMTDKDYAGAIEELRRAELTIEIKNDMDWMDLPTQVRGQKEEAERLYDEQQRSSQAEQNAQIAEQLRRDYARLQADKRARVDALLHQSQLAFEARQFDRAQDFAQRALDVEPSNALAYEMRTISVKAARDASNEEFIKTRGLEIRKMLEADSDLKIPQTETLRMDPVIWARANGRAERAAGPKAMDPQDAALTDKVNTTQVGRLTYTEETGAFLDVIKNLSLITGVQVITTPEAREIVDSESLVVVIELAASMSLRDFLNHMVGRSENLAWTIKNGVVVIGNKSQAAGTLTTEIYPVKDLIFPLAEFLPPVIEGIPNEESGDEPRSGFEGDDKIVVIDIGQLSDTLKKATGEDYWGTEGVDIRPEDSGLLTVTASPEMQEKILKILKDMRRFQTPVVTIDSKFLTISRNFLQEVGVDIRGLGGSGNKGSTVSLDDITNGLENNASRGADNGGTGDPAANPLAGAFFNDGSDGDIRARTENYFVTDLGRVLSPTGGLTAGWTLIDDTQLSLILRAVEKRQDGEVVNSQILSVMDRTRGHVAVINQTAYVRDFDVEVAQAAFIADPKIDVIQDGIVLDVKPIIQNDRKYIVLDLNPTVAELERPIPTFTTSLAGSTLPVTIQLPKLTVTRFRTTAKVPDGGSLLLGGLRQVLTKERRAEVPMLARLPLISFLFKQEGSADENRSLMVMVRAQITDVVNENPMMR